MRFVIRGAFGFIGLISLSYVLTGCGASVTAGKDVASSAGSFTASPTSVDFGSVSVGNSADNSVSLVNSSSAPVTVSQLNISGNASFSLVGQNKLPMVLAAGTTTALKVHYDPTGATDDSGNLTITSNSRTVPTATVKLHGKGSQGQSSPQATLSALSCTSSSITGAGTASCTVTLSAAAASGGFSVGLASNNSALTVPSSSVTVPANATTASFTATAAAVSASQTATLTASAGSVTKTFAVQLAPAVGAGTPATLSINSTSISFGNVVLNAPSTQPLTLTASGSAVTVSAASVSGAGFSVTGATFPMTVSPGTPATVNVQFNPTTTGAASGKLTIANNSTNNASAAITLSGTGINHQIALGWDAPSDNSDPVASYNIYRAANGSSSYAKLNSSSTGNTNFTDSTALSGTTYQYYVTSVDASGAESTPSNTATVVVP